MNNPLAGMDPTGYVADCFLEIHCGEKGLQNPFKYPSDCPFCVSAGGVGQSEDNGKERQVQKAAQQNAAITEIGAQSKAQGQGGNGGVSQIYFPKDLGTIEPIVGSPAKGFLKSLVNGLTIGIVYGDISSIPSLNADPVDNADIEAYKEQAGVERYAMAILPGKAAATTAETLRSLPMQIHHFATNKSKTFTPAMEKIAGKYGLKLDDIWNKQSLPHIGRHPNAYHQFVLDGMRRSHRDARGNVDTFLTGFDKYVKQPVLNNPELLRKSGWE